MRAIILICCLSVVGCSTTQQKVGLASSELDRDINSYVIASCLTMITNPYLIDQGDAWASVIMQRMKGDPSLLYDLIDEVKETVKKENMATIRNEIAPMENKELPVMFCNEISYKQSIQDAIAKTTQHLAPYYSQ